MWQTAGGSETWPVPTGRHHRGRRSRRGARPITSLLSKSGHTPNKRSLPNVRFAPLPKVAPVLPCGVARAKPLESPPAKLSPLWYSSPPTSAPSSPVRPGPRMRTCSSLLGATTRVRSPSRVSVRYQGGSRALTPFPTRSLGSEPQAGLQPSHSPEKAPEPEPEPELQPQTETEPEPEPEPNPAELEAQLEAQALQKEKARRVGHLKSTMKSMSRLQGKKRLLEQSNRADFQLDDGPVDGNALANKSRLALVVQDAGDLVEARLLHEEVIAARIAQLGPRHMDTLQSKAHLATLLKEIGEEAHARALYDEVMDSMMERRLGASDADGEGGGLRERCNQAILLQLMGELGVARQQYEEVIQEQTTKFGPSHPQTLLTKANLAGLLKETAELKNSRCLYEEVCEGQEIVLGSTHSETLHSKDCLATLCYEMRDLPAARKLREDVLVGQRETLSDGHVDTLQTQGNLASLLHELGDGEGALALLDECVPLMLDKLGQTSPIASYFQHVRDEVVEQLTG